MSSLRTLQVQLQKAVLTIPHDAHPGMVLDDSIAPAVARLEVYRQGYRARLREALAVEFPGLRLLLGRRFDEALDAYVRARPSTHYNVRWHGADLPDYLARTEPWSTRPQVADMARLDWAISTAFDAQDEPVATMAQLAAVPPHDWAGLCFTLVQNLQHVVLSSNADRVRQAADRGEPRPRSRLLRRSRTLLTWRHARQVHFRELDRDERMLLEKLAQGCSFADLCASLAERRGDALVRMVTLLQRWLGDSLIRGWHHVDGADM